MKKNILYTMLFAMVALLVTSCGDKESEGLSRFTYYPVLELEGASTVIVDKGASFQDPGYSATLDGQDVSSDVTVSSNVNTAKSGIYKVTYSIVNADGIAANASRTVIVLDPTSAVEGFYLAQPDSYRDASGAQVAYGRAYEILIIDNGNGTISVDDALGGWYCQRAGYGINYACASTLALGADGNVSYMNGYIPGWPSYEVDINGSYNAAENSFSIVAEFAGMAFIQTWVKE